MKLIIPPLLVFFTNNPAQEAMSTNCQIPAPTKIKAPWLNAWFVPAGSLRIACAMPGPGGNQGYEADTLMRMQLPLTIYPAIAVVVSL